ncbi:MAG TPA: DUF6790 family protein [Bauldia sp.]|nr:DUF6790 family protein [Bauldia sp.]
MNSPSFPLFDALVAHLSLTLLVTGIVVAVLLLAVSRRRHTWRGIINVLFRSYLFWTIGVYFLYGAITRGALGPQVVDMLHLSPVAAAPEAAYADLAFAVIALVAVFVGSMGLRFAAVAGPTIFVLAPIAVVEPATLATLTAHAPTAAIYGLGVFYFIVQLGFGRPSFAERHTSTVDILPTT